MIVLIGAGWSQYFFKNVSRHAFAWPTVPLPPLPEISPTINPRDLR